MACSCKSYRCKHRFLVIIKIMCFGFLSIPCSEGIDLTVEDKSYSLYCATGLLENRDNIALDIVVDMKGDAPDKKSDFVLEARDPVDNYTIMVCALNLKEQCITIMRIRGCLCEKQNEGYHITASFPVDSHFKRFVMKVNGKELKTLQGKNVFRLKPQINLKVGGRNVPMKSDCRVYATWDTVVHYELCVAGLNAPNLFMSYDGVNTTGSSECISAGVETASTNQNLYFSFQDGCQRDVQLSCAVYGTDEDMDEPFKDDDNESAWKSVFFVSLLLIGTCGLLFIVIKVKQMYEPEQKPRNVDRFSMVDPMQKPGASPKKKKSGSTIASSSTWTVDKNEPLDATVQ